MDVSLRRRILVAAQRRLSVAGQPQVTYEDHQSLPGECRREIADGVAGATSPTSRAEQHDGRPIRYPVDVVNVHGEFDSVRRGERNRGTMRTGGDDEVAPLTWPAGRSQRLTSRRSHPSRRLSTGRTATASANPMPVAASAQSRFAERGRCRPLETLDVLRMYQMFQPTHRLRVRRRCWRRQSAEALAGQEAQRDVPGHSSAKGRGKGSRTRLAPALLSGGGTAPSQLSAAGVRRSACTGREPPLFPPPGRGSRAAPPWDAWRAPSRWRLRLRATGALSAAAAAAPLTPLSGGRGVKFAGTLGANGFAGDGGSAGNAQFANPLGLAVDAGGNLLIADASNSRIRRIDTTSSHVIRTVAGNGSVGFATENAPATSSPLPLSVRDVAAGPHGDVYIASVFEDGGNAPVYRIDPAGRIHRFAGAASITGGYGGDGGSATAAQIDFPAGVATDAAGNVYIAEGFRIRKVNPAGIITTFAGGAGEGFSGDGGPATLAKLERPSAVATDAHGNVYVSTGSRVRKVTPGGIIFTIAGTGAAGFFGDGGRATAARLNFPEGLAVDGAGNVYIATPATTSCGPSTAAGVISTVAGSRQSDAFNLYGPITETRLIRTGLALDARGDLFISDGANQIIRELHPPLSPAAAALHQGGRPATGRTPASRRIHRHHAAADREGPVRAVPRTPQPRDDRLAEPRNVPPRRRLGGVPPRRTRAGAA